MALKIASLNINGLNNVKKQMELLYFVKYHKIDILLLQEHNVKDIKSLFYIQQHFEVILNPTACLKGGTLVLVSKYVPVDIISKEMDTDGRIIGIKIYYCGKHLFLLNVYAPSGTNKKKEREEFVNDKILYFFR